MAPRVTHSHKHTYNTASNVTRKLRTPGGRLTIQYRHKKTKLHTCGDTGAKLNGVPEYTTTLFKNLPKRRRTVTRAYGGYLSHEAVRHRILRSFFNEELRVIKQSASQRKAAKKTAGKRRN